MFEPIGLAATRVLDDLARQRMGSASRGRLAKAHIRMAMRLGTGHLWVRARYSRRAVLLKGLTVDDAVTLLDRALHEEKRTFEILRVFGKEVALSLQVLTEVMLVVRLLRRSKFRNHLPGVIAFVLGSQFEAMR